MKVRILEDAERDLEEGRRFYELQSPGLGAYFLDSLFSDIDSLILYAGVHRLAFGKYFRLMSKRFPFLVYYTIEETHILIHAVLDGRRHPSWSRKRLC